MSEHHNNKLASCHECDALQRIPPLPPGGVARCGCCGARLAGNPKGGLDTPLALTISALMLFVIANSYPFLTMEVQGRAQSMTLSGASLAFLDHGQPGLALVVWFTSVLGPGLVILGMLYALTAIRFRLPLPGLRPVLAGISRVQPWGMMDVFLLGVLVALVKLSAMGEIIFGIGLYAFVALLLFFSGALASLEIPLLWDRLEARQ